jgi:hypothetical protein
MHAKRQKKVREVIVPAFGPRGVELAGWSEYARQTRSAFKENGGEMGVGPYLSYRSKLRSVKKRNRSAAQLKAALTHPNTRVVNVQAPWGQIIRDGVKDMENRPDDFPKGGGWMVIVSSKTNFSKPEWQYRNADIARRLRWSAVVEKVSYSQEQVQADDQHAIAVAKVTSLNNATASLEAKQSIWNNGDAFAWRIDEVYPLPNPVYYGSGSLGKPYFKRCNPTFKDQVCHQLLRNAEPQEEVEINRVVESLVREVCASV